MQYFYIVGYTLIGNDLTLCKVSLNEHTLMSWARREAIKYDFRTYELYKQPITRTGKITFVRQIKPSKKPIDIQTSVVPFDWGEWVLYPSLVLHNRITNNRFKKNRKNEKVRNRIR